jgi:hypothetical protein
MKTGADASLVYSQYPWVATQFRQLVIEDNDHKG